MNETAFLQRPGIAIAYQAKKVSDELPWLLLLNGFGRTMSDFRAMIRYLTERKINCFTLDIRGSGQSQTKTSFQIEDVCADIKELILNITESPVDILGISMGGILAQCLALDPSIRLRKLILVSTCCSSAKLNPSVRVYGQSYEDTIVGLNKYFSSRYVQSNHKIIEAMAKDIINKSTDKNLRDSLKFQANIVKDFDHCRDLKSISTHTLIIHGTEDKIISYNAAEELHQNILNSKIIKYEDTGHLFIAECPIKFYNDVANFVNE